METISTRDIPEQIFQTLKTMILQSTIKPGEKLIQEDLARQFGVSRTPILSAFSKLEKEQLVEFIPRRGAFVRQFNLKELIDIYEIRVRLEGLGASKAAKNATLEQIRNLQSLLDEYEAKRQNFSEDPEQDFRDFDFAFHSLIMEMSGSTFLATLISSFNIISLSNIGNHLIDQDRRIRSLEEHKKMIDILSQGDPKAAERTMSTHIGNTLRLLQEKYNHDKAH